MKVSVITVVYNGARTIEHAVHSVLNQDYGDIEYIIVDGASTDGTLALIQSYQDKISKIISEPDEGIYNAMNKGIERASGDIIGILNADDVYHENNIITKVVDRFKKDNSDAVYGDLVYVKGMLPDRNFKVVRYWKAGTYRKNSFLNGWMPPHPTFFVKKYVYERYGKFDESLKISADYELMLRFLYKYGISASYIPDILVEMQVGGSSNTNIKNRFRANYEDHLSWKKNNLRPRFYTLWAKPFQKLKQYLSGSIVKMQMKK